MAKNTLKDVVKEARARGIKVETRKRSDGGIRITKINGHRADQMEINYLRALTGKELSGKQLRQRAYARRRILPTKVRKTYERFLDISKAAGAGFTVKRSTVLTNVKRMGAKATIGHLEDLIDQAQGYIGNASFAGFVAYMRQSANAFQMNDIDMDIVNRVNMYANILGNKFPAGRIPTKEYHELVRIYYEISTRLTRSAAANNNNDPTTANTLLDTARDELDKFDEILADIIL